MIMVLALVFISTFVYLLIQFARQECVQDDYEDALIDIEARLEWARTRSSFPFGMKSQLEVSCELLDRAKRLWRRNEWHQAYQVVRQSQEAMNKAQNLYSSVVTSRQPGR